MPVRLATNAMGTRFELILEGDDTPWLRAVGEEALEEITWRHERWSLFRPDSVISRLNRSAHAEWVRVDDITFDALVQCAHLHAATDGLFDPTMASRMRALGFHDDSSSATMTNEGNGTMSDVLLDAGARAVRFAMEGIGLDLGGIAKGLALDAAAEVIRHHDVPAAFVHGGTSTAIGLGQPSNREPWMIGITTDDGTPEIRIPLTDAAFSLSDTAGRCVRDGDVTIGHVIDPRTGEAISERRRAYVTCDAAAHADAWSTALLLMNDDALVCATAAARQREDGPWTTCSVTTPDSNFQSSTAPVARSA